MKKSIGMIEGRSIKKYRLGKVTLPLTVIRKHLVRTDEAYFHRDCEGEESILFTEIGSTQFYGDGSKQVNPDDAIALLDTSSNNKKNVGYLPMIINNPMVLVYGAVAIILVASIFGVKL